MPDLADRGASLRGVLIAAAAFAALVCVVVIAPASNAQSGPGAEVAKKKKKRFDYGDAPDKRNSAPGNFPSLKKSKGPRFKSQKLKLGRDADRERDSKQVNVDVGDDGVQLDHVPCQEVVYRFLVDASGLKKKKRRGKAFLNLFVDWNLDDDWKDVDVRCGQEPSDEVPEHRIQNEKVGLKSFKRDPIQVIEVKRRAGGTATAFDDPLFWYRGVISKRKFKAPGDGSDRRPHRLGEVEDYGPFFNTFADFGDAPEGDVSIAALGLFNLEPLCNNAAVPFKCNYPSSFDNHGPLHLNEDFVNLGKRASEEPDANLPDNDDFDDGFKVTDVSSCSSVSIEWTVDVKELKASKQTAAKGLVKRLKKGRSRVYLNAWVDFGNDGDWKPKDAATAGCGGKSSKDGHFSYENRGKGKNKRRGLSDKEQKKLVKKGKLDVRETFKKDVGKVAPEGIGCRRGTVSVDQDYTDVAGPANLGDRSDGSALGYYQLGETEDYCAFTGPPHGPGNGDGNGGNGGGGGGTEKCGDGNDNDGDGKTDAADPGCQTGPGGSYDPDDHGEDDFSGDPTCPGSGMSTVMITQGNVGTSMIRHLLKLGGLIRVERASAAGDFDSGSISSFSMTCSNGASVSVEVSWTRTGTTIKYDVKITHVSGAAGGTIPAVAAANTR